MNINFTYNDHEEARALAAVAEQKFTALEKFIADDQSVVCDVEFTKVAANQKGDIFRCAAHLKVDGVMHHGEEVADSFEKALDEVRNELDKKLRRHKKKRDSLARRAGRAIKRLVRR